MTEAAKTSKLAIEKRSKDLLLIYVYATQKDIESAWNGLPKYSDMIHYSYDTVIKEKNKEDGYKHRFTIAEPIGQMMTFLFTKLTEEINRADLAEDDSIEIVSAKLNDANAECFTNLMFDLGCSTSNKFGDTLKSANDSSYWFRAKIIDNTKKHQAKEKLISLLSTEFNNFFRAVAWLIATYNWYNQKPVNSDMFIGLMAISGWPQEMLDSVITCLREKAPTKPKAPKAEKVETGVEAVVEAVVVDESLNGLI